LLCVSLLTRKPDFHNQTENPWKINSKFTHTNSRQPQPTREINTTQKATHTTWSTKGPPQIKPTTTNPPQPNINPLQITTGRDPRGLGRTRMQADLDPQGQIWGIHRERRESQSWFVWLKFFLFEIFWLLVVTYKFKLFSKLSPLF
jgi:hypothetical protein